MSTENFRLIQDFTDQTVDFYTNKSKGSGYHKKENGLHTAIYTVEGFTGSINIQGTLASIPGENDWVDIPESLFQFDSADLSYFCNFTGNFVWLRAKISLTAGKIQEIIYHY